MTVMVSEAESLGCGPGQDACGPAVGEENGAIPSLPPAYIKQHLDAIYSDDAYRMIWFKVYMCPKAFNHDWTACPFAHPGERARRRCLLMYNYSAKVCPDMQNGACPRGDACSMTHTMFEYWMHPQRYRTRMCKDSSQCKRHFCFFAHAADELRLPSDAPLAAAAASSSSPMSQGVAVLPSTLTPGAAQTAQLGQLAGTGAATHTVYLPASGHAAHGDLSAAAAGSPQQHLGPAGGMAFAPHAGLQPLGAAAFFGQQQQQQHMLQFMAQMPLHGAPAGGAPAMMGPAGLALQFQQMQLAAPGMHPAGQGPGDYLGQPSASGPAATAHLAMMAGAPGLTMLPGSGGMLQQQHHQSPQQHQQMPGSDGMFVPAAVTAGLLQQPMALGGLLSGNNAAAASGAQMVPLCQGLLMNGLAAGSGDLPLGVGGCQPLVMTHQPHMM